MTFVVVTDSASDTIDEIKSRSDVFIVPTIVIIEETQYLDDELPVEALLDKFNNGYFSTTSQPSPENSTKIYQSALETGLPVLGIHIGAKLSGTFNVANLAVNELNNSDVKLFNTDSVSFGSGYFVMMAIRLKELGYDREVVLDLFNKVKDAVHLEVLIDDIEYLKRGGRVNLGQYWFLKLLGLKPIINNYNGKLIRGSFSFGYKSGMKKIATRISQYHDYGSEALVVVGHVNTPNHLEKLYKYAKELVPDNRIVKVKISSTLLSHTGPQAIGMMIAPSINSLVEIIKHQ